MRGVMHLLCGLGGLMAGSGSASDSTYNPNFQVKQMTDGQGRTFEQLKMVEFPDHAVSIRSPKGLCDTSVSQYSGHLEIPKKNEYLFFWAFESRKNPAVDPLVLWLTGGPGCSSSVGLLMEVGPCKIQNGASTQRNPDSWNNHANIIFLDQPAGVGYSYTKDDANAVNNTADAADDVYAFLQLFYARFPDFRKVPLHIAAASYGGQYAPYIASRIVQHNQARILGASSSSVETIPLSSIIVENGWTQPLVQFASYIDYACAPSPYAVLSTSTCSSMRSRLPACQELVQACYSHESPSACVAASDTCSNSLKNPIYVTGLNPLDLRKRCDLSTHPLCYDEPVWMIEYMSRADVRSELGIPPSLVFKLCSKPVGTAFNQSGDNAHNAAKLIPMILESGIRFLSYAGEHDFICNYLGNERWMMGLETSFSDQFRQSNKKYFSRFPLNNITEILRQTAPDQVGYIRTAGEGAGHFTYVSILSAGHLAARDQPQVVSELINRWLDNQPLQDQALG